MTLIEKEYFSLIEKATTSEEVEAVLRRWEADTVANAYQSIEFAGRRKITQLERNKTQEE